MSFSNYMLGQSLHLISLFVLSGTLQAQCYNKLQILTWFVISYTTMAAWAPL